MPTKGKRLTLILAIGCTVAFFCTRSTTEFQAIDNGGRTVHHLEIGVPFSPGYISEEVTSASRRSWAAESVLRRLVSTWSGLVGLVALVLISLSWPNQPLQPTGAAPSVSQGSTLQSGHGG
jgi:hypothetical protein